jgi:hypothetical protein
MKTSTSKNMRKSRREPHINKFEPSRCYEKLLAEELKFRMELEGWFKNDRNNMYDEGDMITIYF